MWSSKWGLRKQCSIAYYYIDVSGAFRIDLDWMMAHIIHSARNVLKTSNTLHTNDERCIYCKKSYINVGIRIFSNYFLFAKNVKQSGNLKFYLHIYICIIKTYIKYFNMQWNQHSFCIFILRKIFIQIS